MCEFEKPPQVGFLSVHFSFLLTVPSSPLGPSDGGCQWERATLWPRGQACDFQAEPSLVILPDFSNLSEGRGRLLRWQSVRHEPGTLCGHVHIQVEEAGLQEEKRKALYRRRKGWGEGKVVLGVLQSLPL